MFHRGLTSRIAVILISAAAATGGALSTVVLTHSFGNSSLAAIPLPAAPPSSTPPTPSPQLAPDSATGAPVTPATANVPVVASAPPPVAPQPIATVAGLSDAQLDQLLAPIALYPDPLIAEILPASTYPDQLSAAALWLGANPAPPEYLIAAQPWEPPIKTLAHSPSVLIWMYDNPDWTRTLGTAFANQSHDVMSSIQRLRARALAVGSLVNTPQEVVVMEGDTICIEPASASALYVPVYDWRVVYVRPYDPAFFIGCTFGDWWDYDCDWDDAFISIGARWDLGWEHRWDYDRAARSVSVRNVTLNNTTVNRTIVDGPRTVRVGGTPWRRNDLRPAPSLPSAVAPTVRGSGATRLPVETPEHTVPERRKAEPVPSVAPPTPDRGPRELAPGGHPSHSGGGERGSSGRGNGRGRD
jgi:hypothetical protein